MQIEFSTTSLPIRLRTGRPMDDDALLRFCAVNDTLRVEREANGDLVLMTPTGNETGTANAEVTRVLGNWAIVDGRGKAFDSSTGFSLPDGSMRSPDGSWLLLERWNALSKKQRQAFSPVCPEFVFELRSRTDRLKGLQRKMTVWITNGVEVAWLIDPVRRNVTIYRAGQEPEELHDPTSVQGDGVVSGFELVMARVWG